MDRRSAAPAVPGDPDVEPVLLEFEPVHAVSSKAMVAPTAVPVSLNRLLGMIISRLCQMSPGSGQQIPDRGGEVSHRGPVEAGPVGHPRDTQFTEHGQVQLVTGVAVDRAG